MRNPIHYLYIIAMVCAAHGVILAVSMGFEIYAKIDFAAAVGFAVFAWSEQIHQNHNNKF